MPQLDIKDKSSDNSNSNAFYLHLKEAIALNTKRKRTYALLTNNQSIPVSRKLIYSEKMLLPVARYFDWQGKQYNEKGIPIISHDFVSMSGIKPLETPPCFRNTATESDLVMLDTQVTHGK